MSIIIISLCTNNVTTVRRQSRFCEGSGGEPKYMYQARCPTPYVHQGDSSVSILKRRSSAPHRVSLNVFLHPRTYFCMTLCFVLAVIKRQIRDLSNPSPLPFYERGQVREREKERERKRERERGREGVRRASSNIKTSLLRALGARAIREERRTEMFTRQRNVRIITKIQTQSQKNKVFPQCHNQQLLHGVLYAPKLKENG